MMIDLMIYMYLSIISIFSLVFAFKFMLVALMVIELIVLNISLIMYLMYSLLGLELFLIYYLVFMVCEGVLGLALLVKIIRFHGNEYYYSMNLMKF